MALEYKLVFFRCFIFIFFFVGNLTKSEEFYWYITDEIYTLEEFGMNKGIRYLAIDCFDSVNCAAVGNLGYSDPLIRVTTNGGQLFLVHKNWHTAYVDSTNRSLKYYPPSLADIAYPDSTLCIATADSGYYYISRDKCKTWKKGKLQGENMPGADKNFPAYYIYMYDNKIGAISAYKDIYLTTDAGENWERIIINLPDSIKPSVLENIYIPEPGTIFALALKYSGNFIIKSSDWGKSWYALPRAKHRIFKMAFANQLQGWGCGRRLDTLNNKYYDIIQNTTDGGQTWHVQLDTMSNKFTGALAKISFSDSLNGMALGGGYKIWRTTNGGNTWIFTPIDHNIILHPFQNFCLTDRTNIYAVSLNGRKIYKYGRYPFTSVDNKYESMDTDNPLSLRPNPATDYIEIDLDRWSPPDRWSPSYIKIYNTLGECVINYELQITNYDKRTKIDVSGLPPGVYFMRIGDKAVPFVKY